MYGCAYEHNKVKVFPFFQPETAAYLSADYSKNLIKKKTKLLNSHENLLRVG